MPAPTTPEQRLDIDLDLVIGGSPESVREAMRRVHGHLLERGLGPDHRDYVEMVLAEALNNVVEHAYAEKPHAPIYLSMAGETGAIHCLIRDNGDAMPDLAVPPATEHALDGAEIDNLPEGGFGWGLIHTLTSQLSYARVAGENRLSFRIAAPGASIT